MNGRLFIVGTPIGNLGDMTLRAIDTLKEVDVIFCEDTRRTVKLLNHYEIKKPLKSCPYFRERSQSVVVLDRLSEGENVAYCTDAGMPGLSDPGSILVEAAREAGYEVQIIGGVSSLTHFIAGLGEELETFRFIGFLPARKIERGRLFKDIGDEPTIFFESPHRIESTLELLKQFQPSTKVSLIKEMSKISEKYFSGVAEKVLKDITSFKGEWVGCLFPCEEND